MKRYETGRIVKRCIALGAVVLVLGSPYSVAQACASSLKLQENTESDRLTSEQRQLSEQYKMLEEKLFALHEFEKDQNPARSKLLRRAFLKSQESMTRAEIALIPELLKTSKLKEAEKAQSLVLKELEGLLTLLESEDRGKRVRDDIKRHQEYLKEVQRLIRIQKGIRGKAEGGGDTKRLARSQENAANRARKLADDIRQEYEAKRGDSAQGKDSESDTPTKDKPDEAKQSDDNPSARPSKNGQQPDGKRPQGKQSDGKQSDGKQSDGKQSDGKPSDGKPSDGKQSDGKQSDGKQSDGKSPSSPQQPSEKSGSDQENKSSDNPTQERIEDAKKRMENAKRELEKARRSNSIEEMKKAESDLERAKRDLEEILRQLREEEVERTLAQLEGRFRQMLEREIRVHDGTNRLARIPSGERRTDFEIKSGKLGVEQKSIATEAARALMLLREDGSSVAFPETVAQMQQDMEQVSLRLASAKVGEITTGMQQDVIETLEYIVSALIKTQQDRETAKKNQQNKNAKQMPPGEKPLVDVIQELRMLRGLQERINKRHVRYSNLLENPDDIIGQADSQELIAALKRLSFQQENVVDITRGIVAGQNK